ncbi:RNA polymerase sigma-70 factor [Dyadobacter frigoris]|nr:RNA polymerase sigma-70 factor [Dyadobacter frigoris]
MYASTFTSDIERLNALKMGSTTAFEEIYERYWNKLYKIVVGKIKISENAKEIVQDVFLDLWLRREELEIKVLDYYLFGTIKFKIIDFYKKEIVRKNHAESVFANISDADWDTEEELAYNDLNRAIIACIDQLSVRTKNIFELSRIQHKSIGEIAKILNVTTRTVDNHMSQALKILRLQLRDYSVYISLLLFHYLEL